MARTTVLSVAVVLITVFGAEDSQGLMHFGPAAQPLPGSASMQTDRLPSAGEPSSCSTVLAGVGESSAILMNFERTRASTSPSSYSISYEPSWLIRRTLPKYHRVRFSPSSEALKRAVTVHPIDSCFETDPPCSAEGGPEERITGTLREPDNASASKRPLPVFPKCGIDPARAPIHARRGSPISPCELNFLNRPSRAFSLSRQRRRLLIDLEQASAS